MNLNQALKYGAKEDLIKSAFVQGQQWGGKGPFEDPTHSLVLADALQEQGEEGMAHYLRTHAKYLLDGKTDDYPEGISGFDGVQYRTGPSFGPAPSGDPKVHGHIDIIGPAVAGRRRLDPQRAKEEGHHIQLALTAYHPEFGEQSTYFYLPPDQAKEATSLLPNAEHIHQFIDSHFNAPTETQ